MNAAAEPVTVLDAEQCWQHLASQQVGRLVTHVADVVDIVPINFVVDGRSLVFRTAAGSKLAGLSVNDSVVFEVDDIGDEGGWSVVVHGSAHVLSTEDEVAAAEQLPLRPFVATLKPTFVRIDVTSVTGREFEFGPEPRREDQQNG